jgi:hypothetical protein
LLEALDDHEEHAGSVPDKVQGENVRQATLRERQSLTRFSSRCYKHLLCAAGIT